MNSRHVKGPLLTMSKTLCMFISSAGAPSQKASRFIGGLPRRLRLGVGEGGSRGGDDGAARLPLDKRVVGDGSGPEEPPEDWVRSTAIIDFLGVLGAVLVVAGAFELRMERRAAHDKTRDIEARSSALIAALLPRPKRSRQFATASARISIYFYTKCVRVRVRVRVRVQRSQI